MKQFKIFAMLMMLMFTACNDDFLNVDPLDRYSDAAVWTDKALVTSFVNNIYQGAVLWLPHRDVLFPLR